MIRNDIGDIIIEKDITVKYVRVGYDGTNWLELPENLRPKGKMRIVWHRARDGKFKVKTIAIKGVNSYNGDSENFVPVCVGNIDLDKKVASSKEEIRNHTQAISAPYEWAPYVPNREAWKDVKSYIKKNRAKVKAIEWFVNKPPFDPYDDDKIQEYYVGMVDDEVIDDDDGADEDAYVWEVSS